MHFHKMELIFILVFVLHLHLYQECLSLSDSHRSIDNKYSHPYIVDGRNFKHYLELGVQNGEITQEEMDEEIKRVYASNTLAQRADDDISDKFHRVNYFFSSRNLSQKVRLRRADSNQEGWMSGQEVKIIIHGWTGVLPMYTYKEKIDSQRIWEMQEAYTRNFDYNVIVVDWTYFSSTITLQYMSAARNAVKVAEEVADFILDLQAKGLISSPDQVHLIGHSLGAQVAGRVGYHVQQNGTGKIGRITGSDPAGPAFAYPFEPIISNPFAVSYSSSGDLTHAHVSKENAAFVDIIHCNQGSLSSGQYGSDIKSGHADFLPNGGSNQPPCYYLQDLSGCSHQKCQEHFLNSIKSSKDACRADAGSLPNDGTGGSTEGAPVPNCVVFGEGCQRDAQGTYYIDL